MSDRTDDPNRPGTGSGTDAGGEPTAEADRNDGDEAGDDADGGAGGPDGDPGAGDPPDGDRPPVLESSAGLSREQARALRDSFDPEQRERIEDTVAELLDLLGKAHAMALLSAFAFADGPLRFSELEAKVDVAPNTLSTRLSEMTDAGLLERRAYDEIPPRVEYAPTERAEALFPAFAHLHHWAIDHEL